MVVNEDTFGMCMDPFTFKIEPIRRFTIVNSNKLCAQVITYGATVTSLCVPDANGKWDDITLGFDDINGYKSPTNPYIGATIGRVCSRIGHGKFTMDNQVYEVSKNFFGKHAIHGGLIGFDKVIWDVDEVHSNGVKMSFISPDGNEGYPGEVRAIITFTFTDDDVFSFDIEAECNKPTPIGMTNHAYFNLAGHSTGKRGMAEHVIQINANKITDMDEETVPNGKIIDLTGHVLDLRTNTKIGEGLKKMRPLVGYDHNYVLDWKQNEVTQQAKVFHPPSGRVMEVSTNQPCLHFYTSHNMPDVECGARPNIYGKQGALYNKYGSFCMETQWYPDAVNHDNFPSNILCPGQKYLHTSNFKFYIAKVAPAAPVRMKCSCPRVKHSSKPQVLQSD